MVQVMVIVSDAPLLITAKTVRQSIVPDVEALKMPASVNAPVPTPVPNVATYAVELDVTVVDVNDTREPS
jgi:hypothetical protein